MGTENQIRLSAVIPCYREAQSIPVMHERLTKVFTEMGVDWEIIFVDSGSPDGDPTPGVLAELAATDRRTTVVHHTRAFGSQSAYSSGMRIATGDAVILLDGDLQDPPEMIPEMFARWQEGYEVVYGERITREGPALMNAGRKAFYRIFQRTAYVPMPVDAGDFSLLDRKAVDARRAIVSFSYAPLDLMIWLAAITTTLAILAAIVEVVLRIVDPSAAPKGYATLIIVILFIGGVQMICFGVVGSYLAHMYEEIKRRPAYIVSQVLNPPRPRDPVETVPEELVHADVRVVANVDDGEP
jgi:hypothetical protein